MDTLGLAILSFIERLSSSKVSIIEKGPQSVSFIERFFSTVSFRVSLLEVSLYTIICRMQETCSPWRQLSGHQKILQELHFPVISH